jgi:hypothetical protein
MEGQAYLRMLGEQLAHELTAHETIRKFVGQHHTLIGAYAEASVRKFIARVVSPLRVSTGTILYETNVGQKPPQLDAIVWSPNPVPSIFENGDFAIVPRGSAYGFLEIKSSSYSDTGKEVARQLSFAEELIQSRLKGYLGALGVVCIEMEPDKILRQLVKDKRAVTLLTMNGGAMEPSVEGIWTLVNFLTQLRLWAREAEALTFINFLGVDSDVALPKLPDQQESSRSPDSR